MTGFPELKKLLPIYSLNRFIPDEKQIKNIVRKAHLHFRYVPNA
jgi:hypothetical protein